MITVTKATGQREPFNQEKVITSIRRAGIQKELEDNVIEHVKSKLYDNIPTSKIYHHIIEFLEKSNSYAKSRYGLKRAIMELGPSGYPFEDFVAEILKTKGYTTTVRNILQGRCVTHEIDVIAIKDTKHIMIEAKFHNLPGIHSNIHVSLYTKARFDDIKERHNLTQAWIVTNTKATTDAVSFALCSNVKIISWDYPEGESLRELIEQSGLTPITALSTLSFGQKQKLLEEKIVLCKSVCQSPNILNVLGVSEEQKKVVLSEAKFVCNQA